MSFLDDERITPRDLGLSPLLRPPWLHGATQLKESEALQISAIR